MVNSIEKNKKRIIESNGLDQNRTDFSNVRNVTNKEKHNIHTSSPNIFVNKIQPKCYTKQIKNKLNVLQFHHKHSVF